MPPEFKETTYPIEARTWLKERAFEIMGIKDDIKNSICNICVKRGS